jgi:polysaccharide export outer membrane protein
VENKEVYKNLILAILISVNLSACLRFTPSRDSTGDTDKTKFAGEEAFFSLEKTQKERLTQLQTERVSNNLNPSNVSYKIGVEDLLELTVFDAPDLNRKVRVRPDGNISLPLVGLIHVAGLTEEDAQAQVTKKLNEFMHSPQVQLFIAEYSAHKVWVVGEINKPGAYALSRDNYSLIELLSEAGGRKEKASGMIILIPNSVQDKSLAPSKDLINTKFGIEVPFEALVGTPTSPPLNIPLKAGDTIVVPEAGEIQVDGEVNKRGTVLASSKMTLLGAIASAGGLSYAANINEIEVIREIGEGNKALLTVDLEKIALNNGTDVKLRDGDIVRVPSEGGRFVANQTITILNGLLGRLPIAPVN